MVTGTVSRWFLGAALLLSLMGGGCTLLVSENNGVEIDPPVDDGPSGPPDPHRFQTAECVATSTNLGGRIEVGAGYESFSTPLVDDEGELALQEVGDDTWAYFSLHTVGLALEQLCVEYRMDLADPSVPAEVVAFDRVLVDMSAGAAGGELLGLAAAIANPAQIRGRRVLLLLQAADTDGVSAHVETHLMIR